MWKDVLKQREVDEGVHEEKEGTRSAKVSALWAEEFAEFKKWRETEEKFVEKFPLHRAEAVREAFENAPKEYRELLAGKQEALFISDTKWGEGCYYCDNGVYMQREIDDDEYTDALRHEVSHYLDEQQGWYSKNIEYINAVYDDTMRLNFYDVSTKKYREEMLDEFFRGDVCYNPQVSDILSAVSRNSPELKSRFDQEGVVYYGHENDYFDEMHNKEIEIYADVMACIAENDAETIAFLQKYFPNIYKETRKSMGGSVL